MAILQLGKDSVPAAGGPPPACDDLIDQWLRRFSPCVLPGCSTCKATMQLRPLFLSPAFDLLGVVSKWLGHNN